MEVASSPCSDAPLSLPQLAIYHDATAALSGVLVQMSLHALARSSFDACQTLGQKQDQEVPQLDWADVRTEHCCAQAGSWPWPDVRSCAADIVARTASESVVVVFMMSW